MSYSQFLMDAHSFPQAAESSSRSASRHDINPNSLTNSIFIIRTDLQLWSQGVGVFFPLENSSVS
jgi:hypothetical protein